MIKKIRHYLGWNIFFIVFFIVFLLVFPYLKRVLNKSLVDFLAPRIVLDAAAGSVNLFSNIVFNVGDYFSNKSSLLKDLEDLKKELQIVKDENVILKNISTKENDSNNIILAKKIFSDFFGIYDSVLLNKGEVDGVKKGNLVFVDNDKVVGEIYEVYQNSSILRLFSKDKNKIEGVFYTNEENIKEEIKKNNASSSTDDPESIFNEISISIKTNKSRSASNILIDLYGYGGGDFFAKVPENIEVATGTIVFLAIDDDKVLGEVVEVEKLKASSFQVLLVRGYYNTHINNTYYIKNN